MLTTYEEIKDHLLNEYDREALSENVIHEVADSFCPIYYSEIIKEWQALPSENSDTWQDYPITSDTTITSLMTVDLYEYYYQLADKAYREITEEENN